MNGLTDYITQPPWPDTITAWYVLVDDAYRRVVARRGGPWRASGPEPEFSDSEVISVGLIIETFFQGHEEVGYAFVAQHLRDLFPRLLDLDRFNARWRDLRDQQIDRADRLRLVDSAPVTLMSCTRGARCKSAVGSEYFGVVTSKKGKVFGLRLQATVSVDPLIDDWCLAPASYLDPKVLDALVLDRRDLVLIGDKLFNDAELEDRLWRKRRIHLLPLRRDNQKTQWPEAVRRAPSHRNGLQHADDRV